ncbi:enoyl-CoA hydratase/isomerase family protein [Pseudogemmobacter sonorensis]|uniref:enoyl-CoA hydratase/isomerase family protein n=1 Tax=Pseudogemmobacter sonorensis TaxID=2989681 RepID=UPI0036C82232
MRFKHPDHILYERVGNVAHIVLNRPEKLNAITEEMKFLLVERFRQADRDPEAHCIVLRGEGRSFCAGHDIGNDQDEEDEAEPTALGWHNHLDGTVKSETAPWEARKPVIAQVQGHAVGGGCQLAMCCDLVIAADNAKFGEPEIRFSTAGPVFVLPWIIGQRRAREMVYFGDIVDAATALDYGMVNRVVAAERLAEEVRKYSERLALYSPESLVAAKRALNRGMEADGFRNAINAGHDVISSLYATETALSREFYAISERDGLKAALAWRKDRFAPK